MLEASCIPTSSPRLPPRLASSDHHSHAVLPQHIYPVRLDTVPHPPFLIYFLTTCWLQNAHCGPKEGKSSSPHFILLFAFILLLYFVFFHLSPINFYLLWRFFFFSSFSLFKFIYTVARRRKKKYLAGNNPRPFSISIGPNCEHQLCVCIVVIVIILKS